MALTRSQATMIGVALTLGVVILCLWIYRSMDDSPEPERPIIQGPIIRGPNPDGSWGTYTGPFVQVVGTMINTDKVEITIFMIIDVGTGGKYNTHITLPIDGIIKEVEIKDARPQQEP